MLASLLKKDDHAVNVPKTTSKEIMVTPGPKAETTDENGKLKISKCTYTFFSECIC